MFERVTYADGVTGKRHTVYLEHPAETTLHELPVLTGRQVTREGQDVASSGVTYFFVALNEITKREPLEMDLKYGWLVPDGTAKIGVNK